MSTPREAARDAGDWRPTYDPTALVIQVKRILTEAGLTLQPDANMMFTAGLAAGDLLRALGVRPATAPVRRS